MGRGCRRVGGSSCCLGQHSGGVSKGSSGDSGAVCTEACEMRLYSAHGLSSAGLGERGSKRAQLASLSVVLNANPKTATCDSCVALFTVRSAA